MSDLPFWWVLARASGVAAYLAVSVALIMGLALRAQLVPRVVAGAAKLEWHRLLAVLGLAFTALHGVALVFDDHVRITPVDLVAPGYVDYRPLWVAAGVLAAWLMVIVSVTAAARRHLGAAVWKPLHLASYGVFVAATVHGVMAGSDSGRPWMIGLYAGVAGVVGGLSVRRALAPSSATRVRPAGAVRVGREAAR